MLNLWKPVQDLGLYTASNEAKGLGAVKKGLGPSDADLAKQQNLNVVGDTGLSFGNDTRNNYNQLSGRLNGSLDDLQALAQGKNSVSALQLHQALQQNLANQQAMTASANPNNQGMAARTAAIQSGRLGYGLAGQQAQAGLQERNQAAQNYASLLGQARGQDLQGTLGGYQSAVGAYGGGLNGQRDPNWVGQAAGIASNILSVL